jgi:transposase
MDARKLAELLRTNLLPVIWVAPPEVRERRRLLRGRAYLVRMRTSVKNRIHGHLMAENQRLEVSDLYGRAGRAWLRTAGLSPMARLQVDLLHESRSLTGSRCRARLHGTTKGRALNMR